LRWPSTEVLLLFLAALLLRVVYLVAVHKLTAQPASDSIVNDQIGWNLARGMGFQLNGDGALYVTARAPLLPWLVSLIYRFTGHVYFAALLLQCFIASFIPVLVRQLGHSMFGATTGRVAGWLAVVHPLLVFFSGYLLTESLFCVTVLAALITSVGWLKAPRSARAFGAGLLWGLACLTRPTAMPLPVVVALWAWTPLGFTVRPDVRVRQILMLGLGLALAIAPWTIRNAVALQDFVLITTGGGRTLLDANNARVWDDPVLRGSAISTAEVEPWRSRFHGKSEIEVDRIAGQEAIAFGLSRWREWPEMAGVKFLRFWRLTALTESTGRWYARGSLPDRLLGSVDPLLTWSLIMLPLALWGLVRTVRSTRRHFQLLPLWMILTFTVGSLVFWGALRLRVPAEPMLLLYAGAGATDVLRRVRMRRAGLGLLAPPVR
jgi:4-amino-4-deoxy-L-arabinose transferase-like glycosyltransferase